MLGRAMYRIVTGAAAANTMKAAVSDRAALTPSATNPSTANATVKMPRYQANHRNDDEW
jgi:hypothetical protein